MEKRTYSSALSEKIGQKVRVLGRLYAVRQMGGISFWVLQDRDGLTQIVFDQKPPEIKAGSIVGLWGSVKEEKRAPGGVEIQGAKVELINAVLEDYPFDLTKKELKLNINTLLDHRPLSLRHETQRDLFRIYASLLEGYRQAMRAERFTEIKTPKVLGAASEGGANFFSVNYFGRRAFLAQSPQFYKQIAVGVYERVFEVGTVFRAEKHFTSRHVNEYVSLDGEMAFIENEQEIMDLLENVLRQMFKFVFQEQKTVLQKNNIGPVLFPKGNFPKVALAELKKIIKEKYQYTVPSDTDIDPGGEKLAGRYAQEVFESDFIFLTKYPVKFRPFYHYADGGQTRSFDLLFRGIEIATGSQRIHQYEQLVASMEKFGLDPADFSFYLEAFRYAMPPHGGWGMGSERLLYKLFNLDSVKEAVLFPRDVKRLEP
ncbi:MAG: aspartate--tRNA(Asn) ligase [Candidatus Portnoybacteria bacterium CG10_big_fil_rev_8_21_14_0_10_44_7]|uniref:Aspartate--tRNA(Asp/Asn) ligase n=1 Tax=Candidatus Portnoybacteria bacterium CG10_big_fil_rev_8_21_14_0_10_44_7 TaxID=1974816 RepID=A0A2M8KJ22_9BACT|nr:MAG: aspartate--tRNA(Asn) ligase [Candidatus Portnoybacteria bacterium CG10_big_fil_rev_8_21_14_0_10_44_7]